MTAALSRKARPIVALALVLAVGCERGGAPLSTTGALPIHDEAEYVRSVLEWRAEKERFFKGGPDSPVPAALTASLRPLEYYDVDPAWRLQLPFVKDPNPETIVLITNTGERRSYARLGRVEFDRDGAHVRLHLYWEIGRAGERRPLWAPFVDAGAGRETYPAGRYVDAELLPDGTALVDFNLAYNPYCAYGWGSYSCPLTPRENRLSIAVRAGERGFHT